VADIELSVAQRSWSFLFNRRNLNFPWRRGSAAARLLQLLTYLLPLRVGGGVVYLRIVLSPEEASRLVYIS